MWYTSMRALLRIIYAVLFRIERIGVDNIPSDGSVILCSNHISNFDPPTLGMYLERQMHYMAKEELFRVPVLGYIIRQLGCFPVKRGGVSKEAIKSAIQVLGEGKMIAIFPEGTRNSTAPAKKGAAMIAIRAQATIVPAAIIGNYRIFSKMKLVYGKPIDLTPYMENKSTDVLEQVTNLIMDRIHQLKVKHS